MVWPGSVRDIDTSDLRDIVEKAAEVVETRKIIQDPSLSEYTLVDRKALEELFYLLFDAKVVNNGFSHSNYILDTEEH